MLMEKHSKKLYLCVMLLSIFGICAKSNAQFSIYLDSAKNVCLTDSVVTVPLRIKNFKGILEVQGAIKWNPSMLQFSAVNYGANNPLQLDSSMVNVDTLNGYILIAWFAPNILVPVTLPDTTSILSINFKVKSTGSGNTAIKFTSYPALTKAIASPLPSQIVDSSLKVLTDTLFLPGYVSFITPPIVIQNGTSLTAVANGSPVGYQWNLAGVPVSGETNATYLNPAVVGGSYTVTAYYANGCAETSASILLPIVLKNFTGYYKEGKAKLFWTTTSENNMAYYAIEKSDDGKNFVVTDKVNALNNRTGASYSYISSSVVGKAYYRLMIVDKDGATSFSNVIAINPINSLSISIYPNPAHNNLSLHLQNNKAETVTVKVKDMLGRVVVQQTSSLGLGINSLSINVSYLSKGNYLVVVDGDSSQQLMFVKY